MARKSGIFGHVFTVGSLTALSRVLGLGREMLQSRLIGAGVEQSAFTLAFALPNMFRKLFGEGALTAAFVPVCRDELDSGGAERAAVLARAVLTQLLLLLGAIVVLVLSGIGVSLAWADALSPRLRLILELSAVLFPYMLAICGAAFGMGVLNALGKFRAAGFMPALLNLVWILALAVLAFAPALGLRERVLAVAAAITLAGFLQLAFMFRRMAVAGFAPWPNFRGWGESAVRLVWRNTALGALGAGAVHLNCLLDQALAQLAAPWAAGVLGYAERLMDLPLGVVAVAFGTVLLPAFAGKFSQGDAAAARKLLAGSVKSMMFLLLPAAAGLWVLAEEVTAVVYEGGDFDVLATLRVSRALAVYALGLVFFGLQKTLVPFYQAQKDVKTPLRVSLVTVGLNAALNLAAVALLPQDYRHVGLAGSTVLCAAVGVGLLVWRARKCGGTGLGEAAGPLAKIFVAALVMAAVLAGLRPLFAAWRPLAGLAVLTLAGSGVYALAAAVLFPSRLLALGERLRG